MYPDSSMSRSSVSEKPASVRARSSSSRASFLRTGCGAAAAVGVTAKGAASSALRWAREALTGRDGASCGAERLRTRP